MTFRLMAAPEWTLEKIPAPLGDRARELVEGATFTYVEYEDDPLASPLEALFGEDMQDAERDPRRKDAERYRIYAILNGRFVTVELTWLGDKDPPTESIEALSLKEIVKITIDDESASLDIGTDEDRYTTSVPKIVAEVLLKGERET